MAKIAYDKYYTPPTVARWCIEKTYEIIGKENITEIIEPSAGCGMFSLQIPNCKAYDLYPQSEYIEQQDFTKLDLEYKKGRLFIGNPPFGGGSGKLIKEFYNKSCDLGDYIAFIQPANYYWNYTRFYRFEIIYSVIIETPYTNHNLKTSFTIYKRNPDRDDWRDKEEELQDIKIMTYCRNNKGQKHKTNEDYDYCFSTFGVLMKPCEPYQFAQTRAIKILNPLIKEKVIRCLKYLYNRNQKDKFLQQYNTSVGNMNNKPIIRLLKICIPEIK